MRNPLSHPPSHKVLGIPISRLGFDQALKEIMAKVMARHPGYACFSNVHTVTESKWNQPLRSSLMGASYCLADGVPLVWVSRLRNEPIESRVCGPDFMEAFLRESSTWAEIEHVFIGGFPGQAETIRDRFGVKNAVCHSPPMRPFSPENVSEDIEEIKKRGGLSKKTPSVIWVGLGAPKQELWMQEASRHLPHSFLLGVGAAFDFLTHSKSRAPRWMQKMGMEWLFRLWSEPRRLWKRYLITNSAFVWFAACETIRKSKDSQKP